VASHTIAYLTPLHAAACVPAVTVLLAGVTSHGTSTSLHRARAVDINAAHTSRGVDGPRLCFESVPPPQEHPWDTAGRGLLPTLRAPQGASGQVEFETTMEGLLPSDRPHAQHCRRGLSAGVSNDRAWCGWELANKYGAR
jgi:hypothetical protein